MAQNKKKYKCYQKKIKKFPILPTVTKKLPSIKKQLKYE